MQTNQKHRNHEQTTLRRVITPEMAHNLLESFQLFESAHVGVGGGQIGFALLVSAGLLVRFLCGDRIGLAQVFPSVGADLRQFHCATIAGGPRESDSIPDRLRAYRSSPATRPCSPGFRCLCTIAPDSRWYGRISETLICLQRTGQHQFLIGFLRQRMNHCHRWNRLAPSLLPAPRSW